MDRSNIILVGAMGAGKSTVGRRLAKRMGMEFYDSDKVIEKKTGVDITTIFEYEGEEGFRNREKEVIKELCNLNNIVLATGGGAILLSDTRKLIKKNNFVFYLKANIETLLNRTQTDSSRPLLNSTNKKDTLTNLLNERENLYKEVADHEIETDKHTINWAVNQIIKLTKNS